MNKLSISSILLITICHSQQRASWTDVDSLLPGEISYSQSVARARAFVALVGHDKFSPKKDKCRIYSDFLGKRRYDLRSSEGLVVGVRCASGKVVMFSNSRRREQQYKNIGRTGHRQFATPDAAKAHVLSVVNRITEGGWSISSYREKADGQVRDANSAGLMAARLKKQGTNIHIVVEFDPQDGALVHFLRVGE